MEAKKEEIELKALFTFTFGRNIYTIKLDDIKKITLLEHKFIKKADDAEEVEASLFIFAVIGHQIPNIVDDDNKPIYETLMEVKAEESDYANLYAIYEEIVKAWDNYKVAQLNS